MAIEARRDVFQAIADPTRRQIISLIAKKRMNLNSVAENFEVSRPAISQHIKILTECGIVLINKDGRERYCSIEPLKLAEVADWLEPFRQMWEDRYNKLDELLINLKKDENDDQKQNRS